MRGDCASTNHWLVLSNWFRFAEASSTVTKTLRAPGAVLPRMAKSTENTGPLSGLFRLSCTMVMIVVLLTISVPSALLMEMEGAGAVPMSWLKETSME